MQVRCVKDLCVACMKNKEMLIDEKEYVIHIKTLKQALCCALILQKVH